MRRFWFLLMAVCAIVVIAALALLHYADFGNGPQKLWEVTTRLPLILTAVAAIGGVMALVAAASLAWPAAVLATAAGFFLVGELFPVGELTYRPFKVGFWVAVAAAAIMSASGLLALIAARRELAVGALGARREPGAGGAAWAAPRSRAAAPATTAAMAPGAAGAGMAEAPAAPAAEPYAPAASPTEAQPMDPAGAEGAGAEGAGAEGAGAAGAGTAAAANEASQNLPPAGWYADPAGEGRERYWSGAEWTDHLR